LKNEGALISHMGLNHDDIGWKPYIIWNARLQQLDYIEDGLTRKEIVATFDPNQINHTEKFFREAFEFPGNPEKDNQNTMHQFDPQFYPRRYILRDALYEQVSF